MRDYLIRRLLLFIPTWLGVAIIIFTVLRLIPGDALLIMLEDAGSLAITDKQALRAALGLDKPPIEQFFTWIGGIVFRADFGVSLWTGKPVAEHLASRIPLTLELTALAAIMALLLGLPIGTYSAIRRETFGDYLGRFIAILGLAVPHFWLGILIIVFGALWFRWIPPLSYVDFFKDPLKNLQQLFFPALIVGFGVAGTVMRMVRSSLLEVLRQDYIRTAWAKGLRERRVVIRHALKNALIPVVTLYGMQVGRLMSGAIVTEIVFALPGMGRLTVDSIRMRDYPQVQANILFFATAFLLANLLVDLWYAWLDPRIRYE